MKGHPIITDAVAMLKTFTRDRANLVWVMAFPLFLIFIFGAVFSGGGSSTYDICVQDQDGSAASRQFIEAMNATHALDVKIVQPDVDASKYIADHSVASFNFNLAKANGHRYVVIAPTNIVQNSYGYVDYLIPGVMGITIMTNSMFYINGTWMQGKASGLFKKLVTTPMTKGQWLTSKILCGLLMMAVSLSIIMVAGTLFYGIKIAITPVAVAVIVAGIALFSGLGMVLTRFTKTEESSNMTIGVIMFPMMFLGGTFFPLEQMPSYLRTVADVMPLTWINNALRDSMIYGNDAAALMALAVIAALGAICFAAGVLIATWKEDGE